MAHPSQASTVRQIGDYEIIDQLGAGAMGVLYKAYDVKLQRTVALKFLTQVPESAHAGHDFILREARAASALDHKNIATVHSVERSEDGRTFIVMAFYEGESLAARLRREPLSRQMAIDIIKQVTEGLAHAHAHGVIHRDIKPSNVMLTTEREVKIVDFGLARFVGTDVSTQSLSLAGTLPYMSPELLSGRPTDARSDIWSLGVMFHELLLRSLPFVGSNSGVIIEAILHHEPALGQLPQELQFILRRMLTRSVEKRYQSCTEILRDLEALESCDRITPIKPEDRAFEWRVRIAALFHAFDPHWLGRVMRWSLAFVVAIAITIALWPRPPKPVAAELYLAAMKRLERYDQKGNIDRAIDSLQKAVSTDSSYALAYVGLCEALFAKYRNTADPDHIKSAAVYCNKAAELNASLPAVHVAIGRIHEKQSFHDLALQDYQKALQLDSRNAAAYVGIGEVYHTQGRKQDAEATIKKGIALRPDVWDNHQRLAYVYYSEHEYKKAADQYREVIRLTPDNANAHANLGVMLLMLQDLAGAERELRSSISINPTYAAYSALCSVYQQQGRDAECVQTNLMALKLSDKDPKVWGNLAQSYQQFGRTKEAEDAWRHQLPLLKAQLKMKPNDAGAHADLALIYGKLGPKSEAPPHIDAALALDAEDPHVLQDVAEAYHDLGERDKAVDCVVDALKHGATVTEIRRNRGLSELLKDGRIRSQISKSERTSEH